MWPTKPEEKEALKNKGLSDKKIYTAEDLAYDNSRIVQAGSTIAKAVFNVSMVFRLDGSDLVVEVPLDDLAYDVDYPLTSLTLLPAFGAGGKTGISPIDDEIIPSPSRAIISLSPTAAARLSASTTAAFPSAPTTPTSTAGTGRPSARR